jgi:hypothetical protein
MIPTGISTEVGLAREYCLVEVGELEYVQESLAYV